MALRGGRPVRLRRAQGFERYALRQTSYPVRTREEVIGLFEAAGFSSTRCTLASPGPGASRGATAPTVPGNAEYACVTATR